MIAERLVFKNTLVLGIGKAIGDIATFLFLIYFSRSFGQDALGNYAFAMATGGLLSIFVGLGLSVYAIREISQCRHSGPELVGKLFVLRSLSALVCWGLIWLIALFATNSTEARQTLVIIGAYHLLDMLVGIFSAGFMAYEDMLSPALLGIVERLIIMIAGSAGIYLGLPPAWTLTAYPLSTLLVLVAAISLFWFRHGRPIFRLDYLFIKTAIREGSPFLYIMILAQFYDRIGLIILTLIQGDVVTGIFSAGDRLLATINGFSAVFATTLFPSVAKLTGTDREDLDRLCDWALRMVFIVLFPLASVLFIMSDEIIRIAFGSAFDASAAVLRIACWSLVLFGFNRVLSILMISFYMQGQLVRIRVGAYMGYLFLSILLVWKFSYIGLAWAKIVTEAVLFLTTAYYAIRISPSVATLKRFAGIALLCLLPTIGFDMADYSPMLNFGIFAFLFGIAGIYLNVFRAGDFELFRSLLSKTPPRPE